MGLTTTTTNLSYARNELIRVGESFIFDKVADMIYYMLANDDVSTTSTAALTVGSDGTGYDVKFFGDTSTCYWLWDESADEVVLAGRTRFVDDASRTGEGACLFANGVSIGMATPGDCQGIKMEFDYGVTPNVSGDGRQVHGLDIKMTMDQDWDFGTKLYNGTVRGARIQAVTSEDVSGRLTGAYINAIGEGTKTIRGYISGASPTGAAMIGLEARTELAASATITTPVAAGMVIFHHNKGAATLTGKYRALSIEVPLLLAGASISSTTTAIHIGNDWAGADTFDYGMYVTNSTCGIGAYIGTCTTGIQLAGTQTTGIVIGSSVTTGISVDSATDSDATTTGSIHTDGGLGIAKKLYVGTELFLVAGPIDMTTAASDIEIKANTAAALELKDTNATYLTIDSRNTVTGVTALAFVVPDIGFASATGSTRVGVSIDPGTLTFTGTETVTAMEGLGLYLSAHTFAGTAATVTDASTLYIAAAPTSGGNVTVSNGYALKIAAGDMLTAGQIIVDSVVNSTNGATGSIQTDGGLGVALNTFLAGNLTVGVSETGTNFAVYSDVADIGVFWVHDADTNSGAWSFGASGGSKGTDVYFYGDTNTNYLLWDSDADDLILYGSAARIVVESTVNATTTTSGSIQTDGGLAVVLDTFLGGFLNIQASAAETLLDFVLETEWQGGTLINADFASTTVQNADIIGMELDFNTSLAGVTNLDVTGWKLLLPTLTQSAANTTNYIGFDLPTAGALENTGTAITWKGINLQLPAITQTSGSIIATGMYITGATITSGGTLNGVLLTGNFSNGVNMSGTYATGIDMTGTYSTAGISIVTTMAAHDDYAVYIATSCADTSDTVIPLYVNSVTTAVCKARAAEFRLSPTAQLGQWANPVKSYLDLSGASGGTGTVSGLCVEVLYPDEQQTGSVALLELEAVVNTNYVYSTYTSVMMFQLSGTDSSSFQDGAYFLYVGGLSSATGDMWYNNTLKCSIIGTDWYLPFSSAEGSFTTAYPIVSTNASGSSILVGVADTTPVLADGEINVAVYSNATAASGYIRGGYFQTAYNPASTGTASVYGVMGETIMASGTHNEASSERLVGVDGRFSNTGTLDGAGIWVAGTRGAVFGSGTWTEVRFVSGVMSCIQLTAATQVVAGEYAAFIAYQTGSTHPADAVLYAYGYFNNGINLTGMRVVDAPVLKLTGSFGCKPNTTTIDGETLAHVILVDCDGAVGYVPVFAAEPT